MKVGGEDEGRESGGKGWILRVWGIVVEADRGGFEQQHRRRDATHMPLTASTDMGARNWVWNLIKIIKSVRVVVRPSQVMPRGSRAITPVTAVQRGKATFTLPSGWCVSLQPIVAPIPNNTDEVLRRDPTGIYV